MKLCLLVSRRCNLRCGFCHVEFPGGDMSWDVAAQGVERLLEWRPKGETAVVKFFGGEPLLNWEVVRAVIEGGRDRWSGAGLRFELATNGLLLDAEKIAYLRGRPEVEAFLSFPAQGASAIAGVWYTLVLEPGCRPEGVLDRFRSLWGQGYRGFNYLPAYFVPWGDAEFAGLQGCLTTLAKISAGLWRQGQPLRVRNLELSSPIPLCNDALTVDADGALYASNLMQMAGLQHAKGILRRGDVRSAGAARPPQAPAELLQSLLREWAGAPAWDATRRVDAALTDFVNVLLEEKACKTRAVS